MYFLPTGENIRCTRISMIWPSPWSLRKKNSSSRPSGSNFSRNCICWRSPTRNLDHVTFRYVIDGEEFEETYYEKDASEAYGRSIKDSWQSVKQFQDFVRWLELY